MKKIAFGIIVCLLSISIFAQNPQKALQDFLAKPQYRSANIGVYVKDLTNDSLIIAYNTNTYLTPASLQKLITTFCALSTFGPDYKFITDLYYDGNIKDSTLYGNIIIQGHGDPTLGSVLFDDTLVIENMVNTIKGTGIKHITGSIIGDASAFGPDPVPHKWTWEDLGNYYGAAPTALCIYDNTYTIIFQTGRPGSLARVIDTVPFLPGLKLHLYVRAASIRSDQSYIIGAPLQLERNIVGRLPAYRRYFSVRGAIPDPALLIAQQVYERLRAGNIMVSGEPKSIYDPDSARFDSEKMVILMRHYSPSLIDVITETNEKSINLYAEELLKHLALRYKDTASIRAGVEALYHCLWQMGLDTLDFDLYDGSGLSHYNGITVRGLSDFLEKIYHSGYFKMFLTALPVAGVNGTLKYFARGTVLENRFHGKSGSMHGVRNYAGYYLAPSGHVILVVFVTNDFRCSQRQVIYDVEQTINHILGD